MITKIKESILGHQKESVHISNEQNRPSSEKRGEKNPYFEKEGKLYLEILTSSNEYKFAYINDNGEVQFSEFVDDKAPVELLVKRNGEIALLVKMPNEKIEEAELVSSSMLFERITNHIKKYCDLPELDIELCSYYVLFTWFYKKCNTTGYLRFLADTGKGKSRMLKVISELSFYPISSSGASSFSGMMRTKENWNGTLVIDEADIRGDKENQFIKYLNLGFEKNNYFILSDKQDPRQQDVFDPFGPKIIAMREPFRDNATEGRLLSISPHETTRDDIPIILDDVYEEETAQLRNEIARFILAHWQDIDGKKMLTVEGLGIEPRLQQLAIPLSIIFQLWEDGNERFKAYLIERQKELRQARAQSWAGSIFNQLYAIANGEEYLPEFAKYYDQNGKIQAITPSMVAKEVNAKPKTVTETLKSIGFEEEYRQITVDEKSTKKKVRAYVVPDEKTWIEIIQRYYFEDIGDGTDGTDGTLNSTETEVHSNGTDRTDTLTDNDNLDIPDVLKSRTYISNYTSALSTVPSVPSVPDCEVASKV